MRGGGARAVAYLGVLKALEESSISVDAIIATSGGSIVGGMYAMGYKIDEILGILKSVRMKMLISPKSVKDTALLSSRRVRKLFEPYISSQMDIKETNIPLAIQVTQADSGESVVLQTGSLVNAMIASLAHPLLMRPVSIQGIKYFDGGMSSGFGAHFLKKSMCVDLVVGLSTGPIHQYYSSDSRNVVNRLRTSVALMGYHILEADQLIDPVDFLIQGLGLDIDLLGFKHADESFHHGYHIAKKRIPELVKML